MKKTNGFRLMELGSEVKPVAGLDAENEKSFLSIVEGIFSQKAFAVAWMHYAVRIGTWHRGGFHFHDRSGLPLKHTIRLRVFDNDGELFIWKTRQGLKGRLRRDDRQGNGTHVVEAIQVLFGTKILDYSLESYTKITEDRGTTLVLPFSGIHLDDKQSRMFIKTHNYVGYNKINQATYDDCRFVSFRDVRGDLD
jgi:CRISPR-associated protein (TIGR03984 family)